MAEHSFLPLREMDRPRPPEGWTGEWDPASRRRRWLREAGPRPDGGYVLYWMQMCQRARANPALEEAIRRADDLGLPVVVYQGLNSDYPGASARLHRFVLESARDVAAGLEERGIPYVFYLREEGDRRDAAAEMIRDAALAVVDDFPAFILPEMTRRAVAHTADSGVPVLAVDANGVVPLAEIEGRQYAAYTIRPRIHRRLPSFLCPVEDREPDVDVPPAELPVEGIGPELADAGDGELEEWVGAAGVAGTPEPSLRYRGGRQAGLERLDAFVEEGLADYADLARDPGAGVTSGLSPYLHFGCVSAREVALRVLGETGAPDASVDAFLEQLVVRRELAFNFCWHEDDHASLDVLPDWARTTLAEHADDPRDPVYDRSALEAADTHDGVWNAAQRELVATGTIHGYVRMLWGKQIMRWTGSYEEALDVMIDFHRRYALDGRDPNTVANVLWCFGLHDRAFQETPILGKTRPMSSDRTREKFDLDPYFERVERRVAERDPAVLREAP